MYYSIQYIYMYIRYTHCNLIRLSLLFCKTFNLLGITYRECVFNKITMFSPYYIIIYDIQTKIKL